MLCVPSPPTQMRTGKASSSLVAHCRRLSRSENVSRLERYPRAPSALRSSVAMAMARPLPEPGVTTIWMDRARVECAILPVSVRASDLVCASGLTIDEFPSLMSSPAYSKPWCQKLRRPCSGYGRAHGRLYANRMRAGRRRVGGATGWPLPYGINATSWIGSEGWPRGAGGRTRRATDRVRWTRRPSPRTVWSQ